MNVNALAGARPIRVRPGEPDCDLVAAVRDAQRQRRFAPLDGDGPATEPTPEELVLELERARELHTLIRRLRPEQQHLLALRYGAGLPYEEIGAILGSAPATVRARMHRILEELRQRYSHDDA